MSKIQDGEIMNIFYLKDGKVYYDAILKININAFLTIISCITHFHNSKFSNFHLLFLTIEIKTYKV